MRTPAYDLWFDANSVDGSMIVDTLISHGPRAADPAFQPRPGQTVSVGDDDESPLTALVIERDGDRVRVRIQLADAVARRRPDVA